jgi:TolB-like protein/tRNA A-37 threonylcarbamoyl transferase component Bud32/Tfp pilus assembly protein PilF
MNSAHWQRVQALFYRTVDLDPEARMACLDTECAGDSALRREVEALLHSERVAGDTIRKTIEQEAVRLLQGGDASGERLGAWRLLRPLQHGGMGAVYLAERADDAYRKKVAIKVLRNTLATEHERERFRRERQILANLDHACIARLIDGGTRADGSPYLVMEYVEGEPIDRYCTDRRLSLEERLHLFQQVCLAVAHAHRQHVVHRDLKPANILVGKDGVPKLLDFGIAKLLDPATDPQPGPPTRAEDRRLTPEYASPEQLSGASIGYASDIYALGVVLYELLTGCLPYQLNGLSLDEMLEAIRRTDPLSPSAALARRQPDDRELAPRLRGALDNIVMKALQREPHSRYANADDLAADIARHLAGEPVSARRATPVMRLIRFVRRHRMWTVAALSLLACGVLAALYVKAVYDAERRIEALVASHTSAQAIERLPAIAILPFSSTESGSLLGVGISRLLISGLSPLGRLRVTAYNSVRHYPESAPDIDGVARELGVRYVVSGKAEVNGGRLRIEATLTDAATGKGMWSVSYDRTPEDVFAIRAELAEKVASALRIELTADERRRFAKAPTRSFDAYQALIQGMSNYGRRVRRANDEARRHFERAIALDPGYAHAHGMLAMTYLRESLHDWGDNRAQSVARAEQLAKRALALDESHAFPHLAMGMVRREQRRHTDALAAAARAVELDPNYANAIVIMASILCYAGKTGNTIELIQKAARLNPRHPINYAFQIGQCYVAMGRYGEAIAAFEQALDRNALSHRGLLWLAASYAQAGRLADARSMVKELEAGGRRLSLRRVEPTIPFTRREDRERLIEGLRLAGVPD